jgi:hypothetical protein
VNGSAAWVPEEAPPVTTKRGFVVPVYIYKTDRPIDIATLFTRIGGEIANTVVTTWSEHRANYKIEITVTMEEQP